MSECDYHQAATEAIEFIEDIKNQSQGKTRTKVDPASDRFFGPETVLDGDISPGDTYMGPALSTMVEFLQLDKVTHEFETSLFGAATCTFCKAAFLFLQYYLDKNDEMKEVIDDTKMLCNGMVMMSADVCQGLIQTFGPDVFMVMKSTNQSPETICGFMFGEACDNPENDEHEWRAHIPPVNKKLSSRKYISNKYKRSTSNSVRQEDHSKVVSKKSHPQHSHESLKVLHISDTHWDPLYKEGTLADCKDFLCCREESGQVSG